MNHSFEQVFARQETVFTRRENLTTLRLLKNYKVTFEE